MDYAIYATVASMAANVAQSLYGTDDEISEKIGKTFAEKMFGGNPATMLRDLVA
jgi:hypothetical protein